MSTVQINKADLDNAIESGDESLVNSIFEILKEKISEGYTVEIWKTLDIEGRFQATATVKTAASLGELEEIKVKLIEATRIASRQIEMVTGRKPSKKI